MLDNFQKKSHKIWLPKNTRPRNQDFNDYYVFDDPNDSNNLLKQTFEDIADENFGNMIGLIINLTN